MLEESDNQKALNREEMSFREFITTALTEEDPDDIEDKLLEYVNAKDSVTEDNVEANSRKQARVIEPKNITDKALQQKAALETGQKLLEKVRCSQKTVSTPVHSSESDYSETDSQPTDSQGENVDDNINSQVEDEDIRSPQKAAFRSPQKAVLRSPQKAASNRTPDEEMRSSPFKKRKTDTETSTFSDVQYVTFDQLEDVLERYVKKSEFRRFRKRFDSQEPANETEKDVEKIITQQKGAFEAVEAGLKHYFTIEEIQNHSATGKKANKDHVVKPKFDPVKFNLISKLVQKHFDISHKKVVIKTQNVKRKYSK